MYENLKREIGANLLSIRGIAKVLEMPEATFRDKLEKGNFTVQEAFQIKTLMLPKYSLEYLFKNIDNEE